MAIPFHDKRDGKVYYHGSDHNFSEGDTVEPRTQGYFAFASTNPGVAAGYGKNLYRVAPMAPDVTRMKGADPQFGIHYSETGFKVLGKEKWD